MIQRAASAARLMSVVLLAACAGSDVTLPESQLTLTASDTLQAVALSASDATAEDIDMMSASDASMDGGTATYDQTLLSASTSVGGGDVARFAFWSFSQGCSFNATTGRLGCPNVAKRGLTMTRSAAFLDASGVAMPQYNEATTASANFQLSVSGIHAFAFGVDTVSRQRSMTVTNLLGAETSRTWNGAGSRTDAGSHRDGTRTRTYSTRDTVTYTNVVVNLPRRQNPWPASGTVTRQVSGTGTVTGERGSRDLRFAKTVTVTFNGTRTVPMLVGTAAFTLDLFTGKATRN